MKKKAKKTYYFSLTILYLLLPNNINSMQQFKKQKIERNINFIWDIDFWVHQFLPFISEQKNLVNLRIASKFHKKIVSLYSQKTKPIWLQEVGPSNIKDFMRWLKGNYKNLDITVGLKLTDCYIKKTDLIDIFKLLSKKIKSLELYIFDLNKLPLNIIKESNIKKLIISYPCTTINKELLANLPKYLESLTIEGNQLYIQDDWLLNLPLTIKFLKINNVKGITEKCLDSKKNLKFLSIENTQLKRINNWPPNLETLVVNNYFKDKNIEHLPPKLKFLNLQAAIRYFHPINNVTGKTFDKLPKTLEKLKFYNLKGIHKKYLKKLPKSVSTIYIMSLHLNFNKTYEEEEEKAEEEKVEILKNMDIKVI